MSTTANRASELMPRDARVRDWRETLRKGLLACGVLYVLAYVGWHEIAALQWEGYSRISNAISELSLPGAPSRWVLEPWAFVVSSALTIAFGIGVWRSAASSGVLRVAGGLLVVSGSTYPLWRLFGAASLAVHLVLSAVGILCWLGVIGFGAAAFGRRFRLYSLVTVATMVVFFGMAFGYAPEVAAGEPTPYMGLFERIAFSAYFLWVTVFAVGLWRPREVASQGSSAST